MNSPQLPLHGDCVKGDVNVALPNLFRGFMYVNYVKRNADVRSLGLYDGVSMALNFHENGVSLFNFKRDHQLHLIGRLHSFLKAK